MGEELHLEGQDSPTLKTFEVTDQKLKFTAVDSLALPLTAWENASPDLVSRVGWGWASVGLSSLWITFLSKCSVKGKSNLYYSRHYNHDYVEGPCLKKERRKRERENWIRFEYLAWNTFIKCEGRSFWMFLDLAQYAGDFGYTELLNFVSRTFVSGLMFRFYLFLN